MHKYLDAGHYGQVFKNFIESVHDWQQVEMHITVIPTGLVFEGHNELMTLFSNVWRPFSHFCCSLTHTAGLPVIKSHNSTGNKKSLRHQYVIFSNQWLLTAWVPLLSGFKNICKKSGSLAAEVNGHHYHHILLRLDDSFVQVGILDCKMWLWFCLQKQWCCFVENQMCVHTYNIYTSVVSSKGRNSINLSFLLSCKIITPTSNIRDPVTTLDRILLLRPLIFKIMSWNLLTLCPVVFNVVSSCFHVCCVFKMLFIANHRDQFLCHRNHVYSKFHDTKYFF